jgi:hypothetical protein
VSRVWEDRQGRAEYVKVFALLLAAGCRQLRSAAGPQDHPKRHAQETDDSEYQPECWILMDGGVQIVCVDPWFDENELSSYRAVY